MTSRDVAQDRLVVIRVTGMHSYQCEKTIEKALIRFPGVHEAEIDFASGLASVLYDGQTVTVGELMRAVSEAGYCAVKFSER